MVSVILPRAVFQVLRTFTHPHLLPVGTDAHLFGSSAVVLRKNPFLCLLHSQHSSTCNPRWVGSSQTSSNSSTPPRCPTIQPNSDSLPGGSVRSHGVKGSAPQVCPPPPLQMPTTGPDCYLCFWLPSCKLELPRTPSLGLTNLLEQHTGIRTVYLLDYCFTVADPPQEQPDWRDA